MIHPYLYAGLPTTNMNYSEAFNHEKELIIKAFGVKDFITNKTRKRNYVWSRHIFFYILNKKYNISNTMLEELVMEKELTKYDRTTTMHSVDVVTALLNFKDKEFILYYDKYKEEIKKREKEIEGNQN